MPFYAKMMRNIHMPTPILPGEASAKSGPPPPVPPKIPTGRELYDAIMSHIEPDLMTENAKTLDVKYANEAPAEKERRLKRYDLAFERYETAYTEYVAMLDAQVNRYSRQAFAFSELKDRQTDEGFLSRFDSLFQQAA